MLEVTHITRRRVWCISHCSFQDKANDKCLLTSREWQGLKLKVEKLDTVSLNNAFFPTGFSKHMCYELLLLVMDHMQGKHERVDSSGTVLVVSPLVSLMIDWMTSLKE